jgi:hypothetical protein
MQLLFDHWAEILLGGLAFAKVVVRLTPSLKDDAVFGYLDRVIEAFVPNRK